MRTDLRTVLRWSALLRWAVASMATGGAAAGLLVAGLDHIVARAVAALIMAVACIVLGMTLQSAYPDREDPST